MKPGYIIIKCKAINPPNTDQSLQMNHTPYYSATRLLLTMLWTVFGVQPYGDTLVINISFYTFSLYISVVTVQ